MEDEIKKRNRKRAEIRALKSFRDRSMERMEAKQMEMEERNSREVMILTGAGQIGMAIA